MVRSLYQRAKLERAGYLCRNQLALSVRTGTDECNLGAVNLDGQAGLDAGAELPDEGKPAASQRSTCCFQGYGKLFVFFKYGDMFTLGLVKDENPVI